MRRIIAVTGTPGTGKTTFSKKFGEKIGATIIDISDVVDSGGIKTKVDAKRDTKIVDVDELKKIVKNKIKKIKNDVIICGHLSHLLPVTHIIVLRTDPLVLEIRMKTRWKSKAKIMENLEAELEGVCLYDSLWCKNVLEVDTTDKVDFDGILRWLGKGGKKIKEPDWSKSFYKVLIKNG